MATKERTPKTLVEAVRYFRDPQTCIDFLAAIRWPDGVTCPTCGNTRVGYLANQQRWQCSMKHPRRQFSVKVGTIFEDSPIGLDKWLPAMWLIVSCKNGISSYELARDIRVTQTTAWFMLHRLRLAMQESGGGTMLGGDGKTVEADETWIGGKARSMNKKRRAKAAAGGTSTEGKKKSGPYAYSGKTIVAALLERGGRVRARVLPDTKRTTIHPLVRANVAKGSNFHTDEGTWYQGIDQPVELPEDFAPGDYPVDYIHEAVNHQAEEYVRGNVHTNGVENFWSCLKRTISGTYVSVEPFHLFRYLDEQSFRFNERKNPRGDAGRFVEALRAIVGRRLTYRELTGVAELPPAPAPA